MWNEQAPVVCFYSDGIPPSKATTILVRYMGSVLAESEGVGSVNLNEAGVRMSKRPALVYLWMRGSEGCALQPDISCRCLVPIWLLSRVHRDWIWRQLKSWQRGRVNRRSPRTTVSVTPDSVTGRTGTKGNIFSPDCLASGCDSIITWPLFYTSDTTPQAILPSKFTPPVQKCLSRRLLQANASMFSLYYTGNSICANDCQLGSLEGICVLNASYTTA